MGYFKEIFYGGLSLIEGMAVTGRRLFRPLVTVQYPRKGSRFLRFIAGTSS